MASPLDDEQMQSRLRTLECLDWLDVNLVQHPGVPLDEDKFGALAGLIGDDKVA